MGLYINAQRLPFDEAVDVLSMRTHISDVGPELLRPHHPYYKPAPEEPPRTLRVGRVSATLINVMTGTAHGSRSDIVRLFQSVEWKEARAQSAFGARLVGWVNREKLPLERTVDLTPLRYSLPEDVWSICLALQGMSLEEVRRNAEQVIVEDPAYEEEGTAEWLRRDVAENVLPNLRQFYQAAYKKKQIVIHDMR